MRKTSVFIICLFLAMGIKVRGTTLYSTFDTNSTEGNYFGALFISFSSTNSSDYQPAYPSVGDGWWSTTVNSQTFTDSVSGAQIGILFQIGDIESPNELNLISVLTVTDPALGNIFGSLGNGSGNSYDEENGAFRVGRPDPINYSIGHTSYYYSLTLDTNGICNFGYSLTGNFDGTSGSAVGSWYINYTVPPITPTPEPAVTMQIALGGFCLWLARARQRRWN